jgi:CO/xanthine dehydrogenase FAD-binding subunit
MPVTIPGSLDDALSALAADPGATVLAGGTDLMVEVNDGRRSPRHVVAINRIDELRGVQVSDTDVTIGPATTYTELTAPPVADVLPALAYAARTVGSPQIRNAGTIGGNLATASPAGDTLPVLVALDASIGVASAAGQRTVPIREFFTGPKRSVLGPGELVVAVRVPRRRGPQDYLKVGVRNAMVIAVASLAIAVDLDGRAIGIGLGSVGPTPLAADDASGWLAGRAEWRTDGFRSAPDDASTFATMVAAAARPIDDHRSTGDYRRRAIEVLASRAVRRCAS